MPATRMSTFSLFPPPYREFLGVDAGEGLPDKPEILHGVGLIWNMSNTPELKEVAYAASRPGGIPLIIVLPSAERSWPVDETLLTAVELARPHAVLPHHPDPDPEELLAVLRFPPQDLSEELLELLSWRGLILDQEVRHVIRRIVKLSEELTTLSAVARSLYLSRRALGRRFSKRGLPVPSHWLQFCRVLRAGIKLQTSSLPLADVARALDYPDGFTLSNQMKRLCGIRPSDVRERLGWEWVVEAWLQQERRTGGLECSLRTRRFLGEMEAKPAPVSEFILT